MNTFDQTGPGPRALQKAETVKAVLSAARNEFERVGFDAANLRSIASSAGVSAGTVLHHFHDKRELLYAALFEDLDATLTRALRRPGPAPLQRQLIKLTRAVFRFYQARPGLSRTLLKESLFADGAWKLRFGEQTAGVHAQVAKWIEAAQLRREIDPQVNIVLLAGAYLSFFYFALLGWAQGAIKDPAPFVAQLLKQHLEGLESSPKKEAK